MLSINRPSGATALATTKSYFPRIDSDFPRITSTGSPSSSITSKRNSTLRWRGSMRVTVSSGFAKAITSPGRPAPDPTSARVPLSGRRVVIGRQFSMWRSQIISPSLGPINPRSIPLPLRSSAYLRAFSACAPKNWTALVSRETVRKASPQRSGLGLRPLIHSLSRSSESCHERSFFRRRS